MTIEPSHHLDDDETWPWVLEPSLETFQDRPLIDRDSSWIFARAAMELAVIRCPAFGMSDALCELHASVSLLRQGQAFLPDVVADARSQERRWTEIAAQLEISPAVARRRYGTA